MTLFDKLLRRRQVHAPSRVPVPPPAMGASSPPAPAVALPPALPRAAVPLRSLTQYQYDPAFAQFQRKLRQPRGTTPPRSRLRPDDYPPRPPKPRA